MQRAIRKFNFCFKLLYDISSSDNEQSRYVDSIYFKMFVYNSRLPANLFVNSVRRLIDLFEHV